MFYYLDTSIWLDYYEKREKNGLIALNLINKIVNDDSIIIYSDLHIKELKGLGFSFEEINQIIKIAKPKNVKLVHINREQLNEANKLAYSYAVPKRDALHAILARDNEAILVATDRHFRKLLHIVQFKTPEKIY